MAKKVVDLQLAYGDVTRTFRKRLGHLAANQVHEFSVVVQLNIVRTRVLSLAAISYCAPMRSAVGRACHLLSLPFLLWSCG